MNVAGHADLAASVVEIRAILADPRRLAQALPGVDDFAWDDGPGGDAFSATLRPAIALGEIPFRTVWRQLAAAPGLLRFHVDGRSDEHRLTMDVRLSLQARGAGSLAAWEIQCHFTGTMLAVGQRVLPAVVNHQTRLVLAAAERAAAGSGREESDGD